MTDADPASEALEALCLDLAAEIGWARAAEIRLALEGLSAAVTAALAAEGAAIGGELYDQPVPAPGSMLPPGLCTDPLCDHLTLRCARNRTHLVGGNPGHRQHLISRGSQPAEPAPAPATVRRRRYPR